MSEGMPLENLEKRLESVFDKDVNWSKFGGNWQTPFKREFCRRLIQYFNIELGKFVNGGMHGDRFVPNTPPHFTKFAREIGITEKRLYEWAEIYPEFKVAMDMATDMRNEVLKDNSLLGNYESKTAHLFLEHYAGIKPKAEAPQMAVLPVGFVDGFNRFLEQRGEKPIALPEVDVQEAEVKEPEKVPVAKPTVSGMGKDFKKFHEDRSKTPG